MERNINSKTYIENIEKAYFADEATLPNSIPPINNFVGREGYLAELREFYKNGARCFVLHGTGGVGKTALALQLAGEIADEYTAKVFVGMNGMSENPLSARDAMFDVVRQFEREIPAGISDAQLKGLFVQKVQNQPTLIVLDNAANKESVESLKQAKACFITTSRHSFVLTGGESKQILKMLPEDARKLLFEIAGEKRFDGRADELANLAGYLPMALKPLAAILAEDELETAADLINKYLDKKELLKEPVPDYDDLTVEASFGLSYDKLSGEMQERWQRLSVFPADFGEVAIASVLDVSKDEARETQKQLRRYSLLEVNPETKRFNLHDLARIFTDTKLSEHERIQIQFRHARHYAMALHFTDKIRANDRENGYINALKLIDTEWENITAGQKWTADNTEKNDEIAELCCRYSANSLLFLRLHPRKFIVWQTSSLKAARKINNIIYQGNFLQYLGISFKNLGEYRKAIEYYEQALNIAREISHRQGEGNSLGNLGNAYGSLGEYRKAIEYHEQSLAISREIGKRQGEGMSLGNLGIAYDSLGEYRKAIEYHEQALNIAHESGDRLVEGGSLGSLGNAYGNLGEYRKAIEYHEQSLVISREIGDRLGESGSLANLGGIYGDLGEYRKAIEYHEQALNIAHESGDRLIEGGSLGSLGNAYGNLGEYRKAIEYHEQSLAISREIGDRQGEGKSLGNLGIAYDSLGEREKACGLWKEAVAILEAIESPNADIFRRWIEEDCKS